MTRRPFAARISGEFAGKRVLLVEADQVNVRPRKRVLNMELAGIELHHCLELPEATKWVEESIRQNNQADLVIVSLGLTSNRDEQAMEFIQQLHKRSPDKPVILMAPHERTEDLFQALVQRDEQHAVSLFDNDNKEALKSMVDEAKELLNGPNPDITTNKGKGR